MSHSGTEMKTAAKRRVTERDEEILHALALRVRYFSQSQIRTHWFDGDAPNTRRRMKQLQSMGFIERVELRARSLPPLVKPLIQWQPGQPTPNCGQAAYQCRNRWKLRHVQTCIAYLATTACSQRFGGRMTGEVKKDLQATHDLGVAQVWLQLDISAPDWADLWQGEDVMAHTRRGQKLPDGFIVDRNGTTICVIEFGGAYDEQRIRDFHEDCAQRSIPYQLW